MSSLVVASIPGRTLLMYNDGKIHGPFSSFLKKYSDPHTRAAKAAALRIFHQFLHAHKIDLPARALNGECLRSSEVEWLGELAYRPIEVIEAMTEEQLLGFSRAARSVDIRDLDDSNEPNTAATRLIDISSFLDWYHKNLLSPSISDHEIRIQLSAQYDSIRSMLNRWIKHTPQGNQSSIRSLPIGVFIEVLRTIYASPEKVFLTDGGKVSSTLKRDRAMCLLAAASPRPGAIGNVVVGDFIYKPGDEIGHLWLKDNFSLRETHRTTAHPTSKGARSTQQSYIKRFQVSLWPVISEAIYDYVSTEREEVLRKSVTNKSKSFLFLTEDGMPISSRSTITLIFKGIETQLKALGLLDVVRGDPFAEGKEYDLTAYTLRHSAACLFVKQNKHKATWRAEMCSRFGWSANSKQPDRYAERVLSEGADDLLIDQFEALQKAVANKRAAG